MASGGRAGRSLQAADIDWTAASATDLQWATAGNWSGGEPTLADNVFFLTPIPNPGTLGNPETILLLAGEQANSLSFSDSYTLSGGDLTLGAGQVTVGTGNVATIASQLTGAGGLIKLGDGVLTLNNTANDFSGGTQLSSGTLRVDSAAGAFGSGPLTLSGGVLELVNDGNLNFGNNVSITGDTLLINDRATAGGATQTMTFGTLSLGGNTLSLQRGGNNTGNFNANFTFGDTTLTGNANVLLDFRSVLTMANVGDGGGGYGLSLDGSAGANTVVILSGTGTYTGGSIINNATLRGVNANSFGSGDITSVNNATLELRNSNSAATNTVNATTAGTLTINMVSNNAASFNVAQVNLDPGRALTVAANRANGTNTNRTHTLNAPIAFAGNGTLNFTNNSTTQYKTTLSASSTIALGGNLTINPTATSGVVTMLGVLSDDGNHRNVTITGNAGSATLVLGAVNNYGGNTAINSQVAVTRLGVSNAIPFGAGRGNFSMAPNTGTATFDLNGFNQTLNGFSSSGDGSSVIDNSAAGASTLTIGDNNGVGTFAGTIQNTGAGGLSLTKIGGGLITLTGPNTYTGATTINDGFLAVQPQSIASSSAINVGTGGSATLAFDLDGVGDLMTLANNADLTLGSGSTLGALVYQLGDGTLNSDRILLQGTGTLNVVTGGGLINAVNLGTLTPGTYDLLSGPNAIVGDTNLQVGSLPGGFTYSLDTTTDPSKVSLIATAAAAGDLYWAGDIDGSWVTSLAGDTNWSTTSDGLTGANFTPGPTNTVNFSGTTSANTTTTLDNVYIVDGVNILSGGTPVTIAAGNLIGSLRVGAGGIDVQTGAPATTTISAPVSVDVDQNWTVADSGSTLDVSGVVAGTSNLTKSGAGHLTLSGANTLAGNVTLDAGTLNVNSATALGDGMGLLIINGGTLDNTSGGEVVITAGNTQIWNSGFTFTGSNDLDLGAGDVTLTATPSITVSAGTLRVQKITGGFGLIKEGSGTLGVGEAGDYTGATLVNAGVLQAATANDFSPNSAYTIAAGGTLRLNNNGQTIGSLAGAGIVENGVGTNTDVLTAGGDNSSTIFSGTLQDGASGGLQLTKVGTGTMELSGNSTNFSGNLVTNGGILKITGMIDNVAGGSGAADLNIGVANNTTGMVVVGGTGNVTTDTISIGNGTVDRNGSLIIDGGSVTLTALAGAGMTVGNGGYGYVGLKSGSLTGNRFESNNNGNGTAVFRVDGGTLTSNEHFAFRNAHTEFTLTGGNVDRSAASQNLSLTHQNAGTTVMTIASGTVDNTGRDVSFGQSNTNNNGYVGVLNLNSGSNLITDRIVSTTRGASSSTVNFDGGTLTAAINEIGFFNSASALNAYVYGGGAIIDTAGSNVTISTALQAPTGNGLTSLTLSNPGSGYIGAPYVEIVGDGQGATGYATVDLDPDSGTFGQLTGVVISNPGIGYTTASVNLLGGVGTGAVIDTPVLASNTSGSLTKVGSGTLTLSGLSAYGGGTNVNDGTLALGISSALPTSTAVTINNGATLDLATFSNTVDAVTLVDGNLSGFGGVIDDGLNANALTKTGSGTLLLSGVNTYDGRTLVDEGTLRMGATNSLPALTVVRLGTGGTAGTLDLNGFDQTVAGFLSESTTDAVTNQLLIGTGTTLTINGEVTLGGNAVDSSTKVTATGGGNLVINSGGTNLQIGGSTVNTNNNAADVDLSGLTNFTADLGLASFRLGDVSSFNPVNSPPSELRLATNNTITAGLIAIGEGVAPQNLGDPHTLTLGSGTNVLNANVIAVGSGTNNNRFRSGGEIVFASGDTTGTLTIRGQDGTSAAQTLQMGNSTATTGNSWNSIVNFAGHTVDVLVADVNMARRTQGNGNTTATLTFDQGTFEISDDLVMAHRVTNGSGNATATINIGGGNFIVGDDTTMSLNTGDNPASITNATINVTNGTATFLGTINMADAATGQTANSAINITGGTFTVGSNIIRSGGAGAQNAVITLNGGTFDAQSGTLMNLNQLNGGETLVKTTSGTLFLPTANGYTGGTTIAAGTLVVNNTTGSGAVTVQNGATLTGEGSLSGAIQFESGATHSPGNSPGVQPFAGNADYLSGSTFSWELTMNATSGRGTIFDGVDVGGLLMIETGVTSDLVLNTFGSSVDWDDAFWDVDRQWLVFDNASLPSLLSTNVFDNINVGPDSNGESLLASRGSFGWLATSNDVFLNYTAVAIPEPSALALFGAASLAMAAMKRRARRRVKS